MYNFFCSGCVCVLEGYTLASKCQLGGLFLFAHSLIMIIIDCAIVELFCKGMFSLCRLSRALR